MMKKTVNFLWLLFLMFASLSNLSYAQMSVYTYKRELDSIDQKGWDRILLDVRTLAVSELDLRDVRLYELSNSDTIETPYLIERLSTRAEETEIPLTTLNESYDSKAFYVTLKQRERKPVNQIRLDFGNQNFDWMVAIEGSFNQNEWRVVAEQQRILRIRSAYVDYEYTRLHFPPSNYDYFRLTIHVGSASQKVLFRSATMMDAQKHAGSYAELNSRQIIRNHRKEKTTEILIELQDQQQVSRIDVHARYPKDFYRTYRVSYLRNVVATPKGKFENWVEAKTGVISSLEPTPIYFQPVKTAKLKIEILNYDDQPLNFDDTKVYTELVQLIAELDPDKKYFIVYGKSDATAPVYDLVCFKDKIPARLFQSKLKSELTIDQHTERKMQPWFLNPLWMWSAIALVMLMLGYFAWRMIRSVREEQKN